MTPWRYEKLEYSKGQINKAIWSIIEDKFSSGTIKDDAYIYLNNWRDSHMFPCITLRNTLKNRATKISAWAVVAMRIKRAASIIAKLKRPENKDMQPTRMQDIGGCRVILGSVEQVYRLVGMYRKDEIGRGKQRKTRCEHNFEKYDYIKHPKPDGYRGIHLVYTYRTRHLDSPHSHSKAYDGMKIELQFRTQLQHVWATALETVDSYTNQGLKIGKGHARWENFFILASNFITLLERNPTEIDFQTEVPPLQKQLKECRDLFDYLETLAKATEQFHNVEATSTGATSYVLHLNTKSKNVTVYSFPPEEDRLALAHRSTLERFLAHDPAQQIVLVKAGGSISDVRKAYPNYFLDLTTFIALLRHFEQGNMFAIKEPLPQETGPSYEAEG